MQIVHRRRGVLARVGELFVRLDGILHRLDKGLIYLMISDRVHVRQRVLPVTMQLQQLSVQPTVLQHFGSKQRLGPRRMQPFGLRHAPAVLELHLDLTRGQLVQHRLHRRLAAGHERQLLK